jgi:hypothetical protein
LLSTTPQVAADGSEVGAVVAGVVAEEADGDTIPDHQTA